MEKEDRDRLIEVHTIVKGLAPLVEQHDRDINKGKGAIALLTTALTLLAAFFKSKHP